LTIAQSKVFSNILFLPINVNLTRNFIAGLYCFRPGCNDKKSSLEAFNFENQNVENRKSSGISPIFSFSPLSWIYREIISGSGLPSKRPSSFAQSVIKQRVIRSLN
jgi:hypothetical protein